MSSDKFELNFRLCPCGHLDAHALLACQAYNLTDHGRWFLAFRKGMTGFNSRLYGVSTHYQQVHAWLPRPRHPREPEYHLATIFFHMDSAIECLVFALNAFGYGHSPDKFVDITSDRALRSVGPMNVISSKPKQRIAGYESLFPLLQGYWLDNIVLIEQIMDLHDVSKHRSSIYQGGRGRNDPPSGFYEELGVPDIPGARMDYAPMAEIILQPEPKRPHTSRTKVERYEDLDTLEKLAVRFVEFINTSVYIAAGDAIENIDFPHEQLLPIASRILVADVPLFEDAQCQQQREGVVGLILGHEHVGFGITAKSIKATTRPGKYAAGMYVDGNKGGVNFDNKWGATWYVDPEDGKIKQAWSSSAESTPEIVAAPAGSNVAGPSA